MNRIISALCRVDMFRVLNAVMLDHNNLQLRNRSKCYLDCVHYNYDITHSSLQLELLFEEDFGCPPSHLFRSFDREPVAAASLAQVFKAVTQSGEEVAIKAQYIDLRDRYDGDIWTVKVLLKMVAFIHPKFSLSWIFEVSTSLLFFCW